MTQSEKGIVLVTGASRGIGAATAILAAQTGYSVAVNYRTNKSAADATVLAAREAGKTDRVVAIEADMSVEGDRSAIVRGGRKDVGPNHRLGQ